MFRKLMNRIGNRGAFLLFLSLLDFLYGYALWITPAEHLKGVLPLRDWSVLWVVGGVFALVGAFMKRDRISFGVVTALKVGWASFWVRVWLWNSNLATEAWMQVVLWSALAAVTVITSFWPEPHTTRIIKRIDDTIDLPKIKGFTSREEHTD